MITQTPQIFKHEDFGNVRVLEQNGEPWFVAADVCKILELSDVSKAVSRLDADEKGTNLIPTRGGNQNVLVVNESGLYALTMTSRKPEAKRFRKWVTSEVLPSIRKTGSYVAPQKITPTLLRQIADNMEHLERERDEAKKLAAASAEEVKRLKPKADYCERILSSDELLPTTLIAKDYGMGTVEFNERLKRIGIQYKVGKNWVLKQPYASLGYQRLATTQLENGRVFTNYRWTQKGRMFLYNLLKKCGLVPVCEREAEMASLFSVA